MKKEIRTICYDEALDIEVYRLEGISQPFPNHFHDHYVVGFLENGKRKLSCKNKEYALQEYDIVLFNPGDNHSCVQNDGGTLDYCGFNISKARMLTLATEVTGKSQLPGFVRNVTCDGELLCYLQPLHKMIMDGSNEFEKEEYLLLMISLLLDRYSQPFESCVPECCEEIENACTFIRQHHTERVCLDQICQYAGLSKSTLLRAFTKLKGVTPYRYLQTVRVNEAKKLLEQGIAPVDAALRTGFSDQSHFTNFFSMFIGLTPGAYQEIFIHKSNIAD